MTNRVIQAETWLGVLALVFLFLLSSRLLGFSVQLEREKVLSFIFCSMLNRELNFTPPRWSARIFGLTVLMSGFVIFSLYCALFISFLTVKTVNWPFTNLAELLETDYMLDMFAGKVSSGLAEEAFNRERKKKWSL